MVENEDVDSSNYHPRNLGKMMASYCVDTEGNYVHSKLSNAIKDYVKNSDNKLLMKAYADQLKKIMVSETVL
jgi:retron-type reverse transcriptase